MNDFLEGKKPPKERNLTELVSEVGHGRMSRRQFMYRAAQMGLSATAIATVLAACGEEEGGGAASPSAASYPSAAPGDGKLYLFNWSQYLDEDTKKNFEKQFGVKIQESYFESNEELLAKLKAGATGYDVLFPSDYMVHILWNTGLLLPLDMKLIPNFQYVGPSFRKPKYDDESSGYKYSVPYQWGTSGIAVQFKKVPREITMWADLWDPAFKSQINMLNDERETIGVGLMKNNYSINTTVQEELDKARDDLIAQKPLVNQYDSINQKRAIIQGIPLVHCWNGDIVLAYWSEPDIYDRAKYVMCAERIPLWVDNMVVAKGSPTPYMGHVWMNYILDPKVQGPLTTWIGYYTPIPDAEAYVRENDAGVYQFAPTEQDLADRGEVYDDLGAFGVNYTTAWQEVTSA